MFDMHTQNNLINMLCVYEFISSFGGAFILEFFLKVALTSNQTLLSIRVDKRVQWVLSKAFKEIYGKRHSLAF